MPTRTANRTTSRTTNRTNSRAAGKARSEILDMLKEDHKRVKKAYREFTKLDAEEDPERCEALVRQVLAELEVHTALEEELLYPAARDAISEPDLIDEAEVEHESAHALMEQLKSMDVDDEKFSARFTVLCEYVMHHVKEEEGELFPLLERTRLDWETLAREMTERREELMPSGEVEDTIDEMTETTGMTEAAAGGDSERGSAPRGAKAATPKPRAGSDTGTAAQPGQAMSSRKV